MYLKNRQFFQVIKFKVPFLVLFIFLSNCEGPRYYSEAELSRLQDLKQIDVLILNQPLSFSKRNLSLGRGLDFDLLSEFAKHFNKKVNFIAFNNEADLVEAFKKGQGHLAAGRFPKSYVESSGFLPGPDYEAAALSVFCSKNMTVKGPKDLKNKKIITFDKYSQVLSYQKWLQEIPDSKIELWMNGSGLPAFNEIQTHKSDCLVLNHTEGMFFQKQFINTEYKFKLQDYFSLNWMIQKNQEYLNSILKAWFQEASRSGILLKNFDRYRILSEELNDIEIHLFLKRVESRLPEYKLLFKKAAYKYQLPWQLVAAISYQESQWDPKAKSYTGVQGLMQITKSTANDLGIENIHNATENIFGGARYFKRLYNMMPSELNPSDRIVLALAAYNIGVGHLGDAIKIANEMGKNPYQWNLLKKVLPKLTEEPYYKNSKFGFARGYETVEYVEKTKAYYHFLITQR